MDVQHERVTEFHCLHERDCFVMPTPWDAGHLDNHVTLEEALAHLSAVAAAVRVPVNADFEGGYAVAPEGVAAARRAIDDSCTGVLLTARSEGVRRGSP